MHLIFAGLIFVARTDYEIILTAKISQFTVCVQGKELPQTWTQAQYLLHMEPEAYKVSHIQ